MIHHPQESSRPSSAPSRRLAAAWRMIALALAVGCSETRASAPGRSDGGAGGAEVGGSAGAIAGTGASAGASGGPGGGAGGASAAADGAGGVGGAGGAGGFVESGEVTTVAGSPEATGSTDGVGAAARFDDPVGVTSDGVGNLFVADAGNDTIRQVVLATGAVTTLAGAAGVSGSADGLGAVARFDGAEGLTGDGAGNLFVADTGNHAIRQVVIATGLVTTLAGSPGAPGSTNGVGAAARFDVPTDVAADGAGTLFVADAGNDTIRRVVVATGVVTTLAGSPGAPGSVDGVGAAARFDIPTSVACDGAGSLFVADSANDTIRKVVLATGVVTTLAGSPGIADSLDGTGTAARFNAPVGVASDRAGTLFVADAGNNTVRRIVLATGQVTTLAGAPGTSGSVDGTGAGALFNDPEGVSSGGAGALFVADANNGTIRKVVYPPDVAAATVQVGPRGRAAGGVVRMTMPVHFFLTY
jgi:hypothetical protein